MKASIKINTCNLTCKYCHFQYIPTEIYNPKNSIKYISELFEALIFNGITHIHWTGGEPTCYIDLINLVSLGKKFGFYQSMATNGTKPFEVYKDLLANGITRFNISLDSLNKDKYQKITGLDCFDTVIDNIYSFSELGITTKINTVVGLFNINEIGSIYAKFSDSSNIIPRFIELIEKDNIVFTKNNWVSLTQIKERLPEITKINVNNVFLYTNPMAYYYQTNSKDTYAIVSKPNDLTLLTLKHSVASKKLAIQVQV